MAFKVGDKVKCIKRGNHAYISEGTVYTVTDVRPSGRIRIKDAGGKSVGLPGYDPLGYDYPETHFEFLNVAPRHGLPLGTRVRVLTDSVGYAPSGSLGTIVARSKEAGTSHYVPVVIDGHLDSFPYTKNEIEVLPLGDPGSSWYGDLESMTLEELTNLQDNLYSAIDAIVALSSARKNAERYTSEAAEKAKQAVTDQTAKAVKILSSL